MHMRGVSVHSFNTTGVFCFVHVLFYFEGALRVCVMLVEQNVGCDIGVAVCVCYGVRMCDLRVLCV
jgi:hypothetical protein